MEETSLLGVILPALALLFHCSHRGVVHSQVSEWLLFVASSYPVSFKEAVMKLDLGTRDVLQQEIRGLALHVQEQDAAPPQITLRLFN